VLAYISLTYVLPTLYILIAVISVVASLLIRGILRRIRAKERVRK